MHPAASSIAIPGMRISNYRNSAPRAIRLVGLGAAASGLVQDIAAGAPPNVAAITSASPVDWPDLVGAQDRDLNMIVIVCREDDARLFRPTGRPGVLATFVVLRDNEQTWTPQERNFDRQRACCDLFVTTSDPDYVRELVDNLAS